VATGKKITTKNITWNINNYS